VSTWCAVGAAEAAIALTDMVHRGLRRSRKNDQGIDGRPSGSATEMSSTS
jgi:hypothetical protein